MNLPFPGPHIPFNVIAKPAWVRSPTNLQELPKLGTTIGPKIDVIDNPEHQSHLVLFPGENDPFIVKTEHVRYAIDIPFGLGNLLTLNSFAMTLKGSPGFAINDIDQDHYLKIPILYFPLFHTINNHLYVLCIERHNNQEKNFELRRISKIQPIFPQQENDEGVSI